MYDSKMKSDMSVLYADSPHRKGNNMDRKKSIELLNLAVGEELLAVDQYMYFHFVCDDRGYDPLAAIFKRLAIVEMTHVERLAERILFLKGDVIMKRPEGAQQIQDVKGMLARAMELEEGSVKAYNERARMCGENLDSVSKKLFEDLVAEEENHYDVFDTEEDNMKEFGENYLALQAIDRSRASGSAAGHPG